MLSWEKMNVWQIMERFTEIGKAIRANSVDAGRYHYAVGLGHGVLQALLAGYPRIAAVELGVAQGGGLIDLCKAATFWRSETGIDVDVWGFDNAAGLPPTADYRDHPELWNAGQFCMGDPKDLLARLPDFARLVIGNVSDTISSFSHESFGARLAFLSVDLDYYSSTKDALQILELPPQHYVPAVPMYVDDVNLRLTYSQWTGEAAAISEFNENHKLRKIEEKPHFLVHNFYVCHVFDHPIRTGAAKPRQPFEIRPF